MDIILDVRSSVQTVVHDLGHLEAGLAQLQAGRDETVPG